MVDLNIANIITIGLISVLSYAALKWAMQAAGVSVSWM